MSIDISFKCSLLRLLHDLKHSYMSVSKIKHACHVYYYLRLWYGPFFLKAYIPQNALRTYTVSGLSF